ncbi:MAG: serine/threonine-protein phosphatase [Lachnospiraceae bacterium]|nr:serine/threonine-protein phosphatase [Lachnospiraceae bacterium]
MKVEFFAGTDQGLKRKRNEDAIYSGRNGELYALCVADGIGGLSDGDKASRTVCDKVGRWCREFSEEKYRGFGDLIESAVNMLKEANGAVYCMSEVPGRCGSTVVLFIVWHEHYAVLSAGDSRAYMLHRHEFSLLTHLDIWDNVPEIAMNLPPEMIRTNKNHGKLTSAVGIHAELNPNVRTGMLKKNMRFIICSDGLTKVCHDRYVRKQLSKIGAWFSVRKCVESSINEVLSKGAPDNVSLIAVRVS